MSHYGAIFALNETQLHRRTCSILLIVSYAGGLYMATYNRIISLQLAIWMSLADLPMKHARRAHQKAEKLCPERRLD
jgi:hypothetical protein